MKTLNLVITSGLNAHLCALVDGTPVKLAKNKMGSYEGVYTTEKDTVELCVYKYLELKSKLWLLMSLVFFVVSLFGILSPRYDRHCVTIEYKASIKLKDNTDVTLSSNKFVDNGKAFELTSNAEVNETTNLIYTDKVAKKRLRILRAIEAVLWVALIALIIALIAKR